MLKKLYKYDWKSVSLLLLIIHGILLIYTLFGRLGASLFLFPRPDALSDSAGMTLVFYMLIYVLFIFGVAIVTFMYLAVRIQKSLFSDEGYLTHTLPVSGTKILWSKIFLFWTWTAIDAVCMVVSAAVLFIYPENASVVWKFFEDFFKLFAGAYGANDQLTAVLTLVTGLVQYFGYYTMLLIFSLCLGNLFKTHKIMGAVLSFFGIHIGLSILNTIILVLVPQLSLIGVSVTTSSQTSISYSPTLALGYALIHSLLLTVVFFLGSRYILLKKLNLE